jgi:hypothetical protein
MRFFFGIVVGIALTIGVAYVHDLSYAATAPAPGETVAAKPFVNWDSVGLNARAAAAAIREKWDKLTGK